MITEINLSHDKKFIKFLILGYEEEINYLNISIDGDIDISKYEDKIEYKITKNGRECKIIVIPEAIQSGNGFDYIQIYSDFIVYKDNFTHDYTEGHGGRNLLIRAEDVLTNLLKDVMTRKQGRELTSVLRIGKNRQLPRNVEGVIGTFVSGKNGSISQQRNQLKQNTGISLAPRARRKTRRNAKY
jgi:hypothetical protein